MDDIGIILGYYTVIWHAMAMAILVIGYFNGITHKVVPPSYKLVYNPNNYRYNPLMNPSYSTYKLNANYGAPPCMNHKSGAVGT